MEIKYVMQDPKNFGWYQKLQMLYVAFANVVNSLHMVASVFISASPDFRCAIPSIDNQTSSYAQEGLNISDHYPLKEDGTYDTCKFLDSNLTCQGYIYDKSQFISTTVSEFDLVCDRLGLSTVAGMIYMAGLLAGALIFGTIADLLGRKTTVIICIWLQGALALSVRFANVYTVFVVLRFFLGAVSIGGLVSAFIIVIEISPPSWRPITAIIQTLGWCGGVMLLSLLSYFIRDWRTLQLSLACFSIPFMLTYWWLLCEPPCWLVSKGKVKRALKFIKDMKKRNKLDNLDLELLEKNHNSVTSQSNEDSNADSNEIPDKKWTSKWIRLFKSRVLLTNILVNCFGWFVVSMGYYGLALNVGNLVGDVYLNNFIGGLVEVPAYLLLFVTLKVGRKWPYVAMNMIGGVALIASAFLITYASKEYNWVIITVSMMGKFMVSSSFELIYFWSAEMYPTPTRNMMVGWNSVSARIGAIISPAINDIVIAYDELPIFINYMYIYLFPHRWVYPSVADADLTLIGSYNSGLYKYTTSPFSKGIAPLVFGTLMVAGALVAIIEPETNNMPLPESFEEANKMTWKWSKREEMAKHEETNHKDVELTGIKEVEE